MTIKETELLKGERLNEPFNQYLVVCSEQDTPQLWDSLGMLPIGAETLAFSRRELNLPRSFPHLKEGITIICQNNKESFRLAATPGQVVGKDGNSLTDVLENASHLRLQIPPTPLVNVSRYDEELMDKVIHDWSVQYDGLTKGETAQMATMTAAKLALIEADKLTVRDDLLTKITNILLHAQLNYLARKFNIESNSLTEKFLTRWQGTKLSGESGSLPNGVKVAGSVLGGLTTIVGGVYLARQVEVAGQIQERVQSAEVSNVDRPSFLDEVKETVYHSAYISPDLKNVKSKTPLLQDRVVKSEIKIKGGGFSLVGDKENQYWRNEMVLNPEGIKTLSEVEKSIQKIVKYTNSESEGFQEEVNNELARILKTSHPETALLSLGVTLNTLAGIKDPRRRKQVLMGLVVVSSFLLTACDTVVSPEASSTEVPVKTPLAIQAESEELPLSEQNKGKLTTTEADPALARWVGKNVWVSVNQKIEVKAPIGVLSDESRENNLVFVAVDPKTGEVDKESENILWGFAVYPVPTLIGSESEVSDIPEEPRVVFLLKHNDTTGATTAFALQRNPDGGSMSTLTVNEKGVTKKTDLELGYEQDESGQFFLVLTDTNYEGENGKHKSWRLGDVTGGRDPNSLPPTSVPPGLMGSNGQMILTDFDANSEQLQEVGPTNTPQPAPTATENPTPVPLTEKVFLSLSDSEKQDLWNNAPNEFEGLTKSNFSTIKPYLVLYRDKEGNSQMVLNLLNNQISGLLDAGIAEFELGDLTIGPPNGNKMELQAFVPDIANNIDQQDVEAAEIKMLEEMLDYIIKDGVKWGDLRSPRAGDIPKEYLEEYLKNHNFKGYILNTTPVGTLTITSFVQGEGQDQFDIFYRIITYNGEECTIVYYKSPESEYGIRDKSLFVKIPGNRFSQLLEGSKVTIPPKP